MLRSGVTCAALAVTGVLFAAEPIEQIVVVAHKDERPISEIAANVTVLSRSELDAELATSIGDVFRYLPGIDHEGSGTRFGTEGINIRGIGGNRVAIVVDGVPMADHFSVGSFSNATRDFIDAGLIENIEVLHGPASALYGSSAIGGVVAVRTPDPVDLLSTDNTGGDFLATWRGADDSVHGKAMAAFGSRSLGLVAGLSWRDGSETESAAAQNSLDTRDYERRTALLKLVFDDRSGNTWRASLVSQDAATESSLNSMLGQGRFRSTTALDGDDDYDMDMFTLSYDFGSGAGWIDQGSLTAYVQSAAIEQATLDERAAASTPVSIDRLFVFDQDLRGAELNLWKEVGSGRVGHRVGAGLEYRERHTREFRDGLSTDLTTGVQTNVILGEVFPLRDFPNSTTKEMGAYVEDTITAGDWTVIAALRADRFDLSPQQDAMYLEDYPFADVVSLSESDLSPKLGLIWHASAGTDVYLQYSHGFRAPPYSDANIGLELPVFNVRAIPNADLKSESSDGFDLGLRWQGANARAHVSLFHTRYDDFIESKVRLGPDPVSGRILFQSQNLKKTTIEGIEAGWLLRKGPFGFDGSAFHARGTNEETGEPLNSVGPPQLVLGISWRSANERNELRLRSTMTDDWSERDETGGELFEPDGYAVFDLYMTRRLGERTTLRAGFHNLTDRTYWKWSEVRGLSPDDPILEYLAKAGRSASMSLNVNW